MNDFIDLVYICVYCGDLMEAPNERQREIFGKPMCCEFDMLKIEREKMHTILRSLDNLKKNIETELLSGMI